MEKKTMEMMLTEMIQSISEMFTDQEIALQFRELGQKGLANLADEKAVEGLEETKDSTNS